MIIGSFAILSGTLGLPFLCAATVRSVTHTSALTVYSRDHAPGDKPKLQKVHEQRITALAVHIMMGKGFREFWTLRLRFHHNLQIDAIQRLYNFELIT